MCNNYAIHSFEFRIFFHFVFEIRLIINFDYFLSLQITWGWGITMIWYLWLITKCYIMVSEIAINQWTILLCIVFLSVCFLSFFLRGRGESFSSSFGICYDVFIIYSGCNDKKLINLNIMKYHRYKELANAPRCYINQYS